MQVQTQTLKAQGIQLPLELPEGLAALAGKPVVLLGHFPGAWSKVLWGRQLHPVKPEDLLDQAVVTALRDTTRSRDEFAIEVEKLASAQIKGQGKVPVGWHALGEGNLTRILLDWADWVASNIRTDERRVILSLGGRAADKKEQTWLRYVDVVSLLKAIPWRAGGSVNGTPVTKRLMQGLALIGVALNTERPQTLIRQGVEESIDFTGGEVVTSGWPQFFRPLTAYGELSEFASNNVDHFTGHVTLRFKRFGWMPELEVLMGTAALKASVIAEDLKAGQCHIPHDQLKNSSVGQGTRATWLVDGQVLSLPGAGSKPEKFLNRNKLTTGTGATLERPVVSALRIVTE